MNHIFDGPAGPIRAADYKSLFNAMSKEPLGNEALFDFLRSNFDKILSDLLNGEKIVVDIFTFLTDAATDETIITKVSFLHRTYTNNFFNLYIKNIILYLNQNLI